MVRPLACGDQALSASNRSRRAAAGLKLSFGAGKPDFVPRLAARWTSFLSSPCGLVLRSLSAEAIKRSRMRHTRGYRAGHPAAYFALHRTGFFVPPTLPSTRWALTPPFHPCLSEPPCGESNRRFIFCDTVRRRALRRGARTCLAARAASCPVVSGLSSPKPYRARRSTAPWDVKNSERRPGPKTKRRDPTGCRPKCKIGGFSHKCT